MELVQLPPNRRQIMNHRLDPVKGPITHEMWATPKRYCERIKVINNPNQYPITDGRLMCKSLNGDTIEVLIFQPITKTRGKIYLLFQEDIESLS